MKCGYASYFLTVFDAFRIVAPSPDEMEPSLDEVKSHHWSLHVTNDSRSLKRHNEGKNVFGCND